MKCMRIQGREESYITKYPKGIFCLCWNLIRDDILTSEEKELFISMCYCYGGNSCSSRYRCVSFG